jgi:predicted ATPase
MKQLEYVDFSPITIFYGGNGSGKTTLLNIIAEKIGAIRHSQYNKSPFF